MHNVGDRIRTFHDSKCNAQYATVIESTSTAGWTKVQFNDGRLGYVSDFAEQCHEDDYEAATAEGPTRAQHASV